jgi:cytochrome b561
MEQPDRYARAQVWLHWAVAVLILGSFLTSEAMENSLRAAARGEVAGGLAANAHQALGLTILLLTLARIALRLTHGAPPLPPDMPPLLRRAAQVTHVAIYALLLAVPAAGMAAWSRLDRDLGELHGTLFGVLAALVALHVAAAVFHQVVLKDGLMRRMIP